MKPAAQYGPRMEGEPVLTAKAERDSALSTLHGSPGWAALKEIIQTLSRFDNIDLSDANYALKAAARDARIAMGLTLLKAVENAKAPVAKEIPTA